jgi:hypothetical protein
MSDELHERLHSLRADLDGVPLAAPSAVRRRGERRTRHQVAGAAVASVAALGLVGTVAVSALGAENDAAPRPIIATTPTAEASPGLVEALADDPLLTGADLGEFPVYGVLMDSPDAPQVPPMCADDPAGLAAAERAARYFYSDLDANAAEWVLRFDTVEQAGAAAAQLAQGSVGGACAEDVVEDEFDSVSTGPSDVGAGDEAYRTTLTTTPKPGVGSSPSYQELVVGRRGNVVVALFWSSMGKPDESGGTLLGETLVEEALGAATG